MNTFLAVLITVTVFTVDASFHSLDDHGYGGEPKLISQSVHLREIPTKIIKVTKTAVIKVPVPYPVKIPHHIPIPVPVNHPVAVPYPKLVKVYQHVPIEVPKPVPVELPQQVPVILSRPIPLPHPVPVPHPVPLEKPYVVSVPHPIPYQSESYSEGGVSGYSGGYGDSDDHVGHESTKYSAYTVNNDQGHAGYDQQAGDQSHFQPSQPDYTPGH